MPRHRLSFHFADEGSGDRMVWRAWLTVASLRIRDASTLGERRPYVELAAPFPHRLPIGTRRDEEEDGLGLARLLLDELVALSRSSGRTVRLLLSGQVFGSIDPAGCDAAVAGKIEEWESLVAAHAPEEPRWKREGWVSIWAGRLPRADFDRLLEERYGTERPISALARSLGIHSYDHDLLESVHHKQPLQAWDAIGKMSFAESFAAQIPEGLRTQKVDTVLALYDADFSQRRTDVAGKRLRFFGAYPYQTRDGDQ